MTHLTRTTPLLGRQRNADGSTSRLSYPDDAHLLTVARTRSGKGRCVILPNLATYAGSVIVIDPKGENCELTAQWREANGQTVHVFDPFHVVPDALLPANGRASLNPIDLVRSAPSPLSVALMIAEALIIPSERDPHWGEAAQALLAAYILHVAYNEEFASTEEDLTEGFPEDGHRTLASAWACFTSPKLSAAVLEKMLESGDEFIAAQAQRVIEGMAAGGPEMASIRNTFYTQCVRTLSEPDIVRCLSASTMDFADISRRPMSVYIVLPGWASVMHKRFMRLLLNCAMAQIEMAGLPAPGSLRQPATLFILDEFATLGRMQTIVEAMGRMAGYGVKLWPFIQNISQLKARDMYGDGWTAIAGNTGVFQYFGGTNDIPTADYLSKLCGETTRITDSQTTNTKPDAGTGTSFSKYKRLLLTVDEIANLPCDPGKLTGNQLILYTGQNSVDPTRTGMYYIDRDFPEFNAFLAARKPGATPPPSADPAPSAPPPNGSPKPFHKRMFGG